MKDHAPGDAPLGPDEETEYFYWLVFDCSPRKVTVCLPMPPKIKKSGIYSGERNFLSHSSELNLIGIETARAGEPGIARSGLHEPARIDQDGRKTTHCMPADSNLENLMAHYQQGDFNAAADLIARLSPQLQRFFVAQSASRADADDLLQETWLRIHKVRHTYRPSEPVLPWFYAIARRVRVDHYRKSSRTTARQQATGRNVKDCGAGFRGIRPVWMAWLRCWRRFPTANVK